MRPARMTWTSSSTAAPACRALPTSSSAKARFAPSPTQTAPISRRRRTSSFGSAERTGCFARWTSSSDTQTTKTFTS
eukprot:356930-Pleurochrysis_carterae.AAC.1